MIGRIDKETVQFICKHKLTFQQFAICLLIYHQDIASIIQIQEENGGSKIGDGLIPVKFNKQTNKMDYKHELTDLVERGYILNQNPVANEFILDYFKITPKFTKDFLVDVLEAPQEAWNAYPKFVLIGEKEVLAKTTDFDEFVKKYLKAINYTIKEHKIAMEDIAMIKKNSKYAPTGIEKWVGGRLWKERQGESSRPKSRILN